MEHMLNFDSILDGTDDAIIIVNEEHKIIFENTQAEQIFGNNFKGMPLSNLIRDSSIIETYQSVLKNKDIQSTEYAVPNFSDNLTMRDNVFNVKISYREHNKGDFITIILKNIPLIMLTARGEEEDRLRGFEAEVDDYITKPFSVNELIARIKAVLKRLRPIFYEEVLTYKNIHMDISTHKVTRENKIIKLGPTEFNLLRFFLENQGRVYSREQLLDHVWQHGSYVEPRTVDVHIRRLRKAINDGYKEDPIRTIRSAGYSLGL